ncbi:MAG: WG repeat-containing protein [Moorea sp. SIO2B7]|nr:WG repeat-containing protein [Moorena sp. SIO2B7]
MIKSKFDEAEHFYEGMAAVKIGDKYGFICNPLSWVGNSRRDAETQRGFLLFSWLYYLIFLYYCKLP